jgi:AhpD family alkylhydroperoxidase
LLVLHLSHPLDSAGHLYDRPNELDVTTEDTMQARMTHPVVVLPDAMSALLALSKAAHCGTIPPTTQELIHLRVSQINGCSVCVDMHARALKETGETDERIWGVGAWRESPYFSDAERAALDLAEHLTRLADRPDAVPDAVWDNAADHYDEKELSSLLISIAGINVWNRLNAAIRQPVGSAAAA